MDLFSERIKKIRYDIGKSQTEMADSLGMSRDAYANFEYDRIKNENAKRPTIKAICHIYGINEEWINTGKGEMYASKSEEQKLASSIISSGCEEKIHLFTLLAQLSDEDVCELYHLLEKISMNFSKQCCTDAHKENKLHDSDI